MRLSSRQLLRFLPAVALLIGCRVAETPRITLPSQFTTTRDPLVVHSDFPFPENHPLLGELAARRADLQELLDLSIPEKPIHVYLFEHGDRFREYLRLYHPELPNRRAFFLPTDARLSVFAQWGDRAAEDLRHEVTHAYLRRPLRICLCGWMKVWRSTAKRLAAGTESTVPIWNSLSIGWQRPRGDQT